MNHSLKDGNGKVYETMKIDRLNNSEKEKMLNALINGYEVVEPKFNFYNFSDKTVSFPLYYAGKFRQLTDNKEDAL